MMPISDTQEFALRFNEEEAIWQRFQENRLTRRLREADSPLPESALDQLDWLEAEREIRTTRAVANKFATRYPSAESVRTTGRKANPTEAWISTRQAGEGYADCFGTG
jgi:hypothetical protein